MGNLRGSVLMVAAMAGFALEDMFIKSAARSLPVGEILILFGLAGMAAFIALALRRGERVLHPAILSRPILLRAMSEVAGRLGYTLALAFTPLSSASAILQATPLVVVAGAALFFGETVGWRRWAAILVGFAGVLIILRPGLEGFELASLWAVLGMLGFAGRDLATRAAPPVLSNVQLGIYGFFMLIPTGAAMLAVTGGWVVPDAATTRDLALATLFGVAAYYGLTAAMRIGEVSVITPFRYTRLVFALALGMAVFAERPDAATLAGSAIIIGSGLYTLVQGRRR
ncbi:EamA family transporter [Rhodobacter veldkampii DSM 11550]|uniref:EamA family transporter n=1 Tax=Phaeovulum veldkampii DSM 11550 TaxID=1185920 RepID=A0A2T4JMJ1_9RHOB|nr:DMT family transporter [Phaeovulum veldkampii]MBK5946664.1 EamA family transporter [Phaeovulum veldkampii DSM 11550]NCU19723.1 DMT family transporter [Candidatus Falkowbacteria bacterium]PTE19120.1 EamA family transporter [Phaeovulum veldkampii DSM 11550]TDQ61321.1 EamA-like transporter family protein [Phaeovulum veldkampii DSM 11550]